MVTSGAVLIPNVKHFSVLVLTSTDDACTERFLDHNDLWRDQTHRLDRVDLHEGFRSVLIQFQVIYYRFERKPVYSRPWKGISGARVIEPTGMIVEAREYDFSTFVVILRNLERFLQWACGLSKLFGIFLEFESTGSAWHV
jgi:hypothetical protein